MQEDGAKYADEDFYSFDYDCIHGSNSSNSNGCYIGARLVLNLCGDNIYRIVSMRKIINNIAAPRRRMNPRFMGKSSDSLDSYGGSVA